MPRLPPAPKGGVAGFFYLSSMCVLTMTTDPLRRPGRVLTLSVFLPLPSSQQKIHCNRVPTCLIKSIMSTIQSRLWGLSLPGTGTELSRPRQEFAGVQSRHNVCC